MRAARKTRVAASAALALALAACTTMDPSTTTGTQSLQVTLLSPSDPGSQTDRVQGGGSSSATVSIAAVDDLGNPVTTYNNDVQVYVQYLGTLTPYLCFDTQGCEPLATIHMANGVGSGTIALPAVYGPTELWFDDGQDAKPSGASGTSTTIWYTDPFIHDIQAVDETRLDAFQYSPLNDKNVQIQASHYGSDGRLVVTSTFSQGYTLADVKCGPGGMPPCVGSNYDYVEVYSFSQPEDEDGYVVHEGEVINGFAGGVSEFDGLTEIGFPQTFAGSDAPVASAYEPPDWVLGSDWFTGNGSDQLPDIIFKRAQAAAIDVDGALVCPLDSDYTTYKQWKLAFDGNCANKDNLVNVISEGVVPIDPTGCVGKILPRVTGMLRPVSIGGFHVWVIYPRSSSDLQLPSGDAQCMFISG